MSVAAVPAAEAALPRGPFRLALAIVVVTIALILMGAMVTSTGSGMAFPDWPLSDGQLMPERALTQAPAFFEHFHRVVGMVDGCLALALTIWVSAARIGTARLRSAVVVGLVLIGVQGLIGGNGVLQNLPVANSATHGTVAQLTIATFAVIAYALSPRWRATVPRAHASAGTGRVLTAVGLALLILQTMLGAIARHGGPEYETFLWTHVGNAFFVFLLLLVVGSFVVGRFADVPGVRRLSSSLLLLLILQIGLGFVALMVRTGKHPENIEHLWRASLISAHVLTGALLTVTASLLAAHVRRGTLRPGAS
jgi:cytochrome c oxidase assembly protein subunit 15